MQYLQFMFRSFSTFAGCFLILFVAAVLLMIFLQSLIERLTRLVYVWRFPTEVKDINDVREQTPAATATEAATK